MIRNLLALAGLIAVALTAALGIQAYDNYDPVLDAHPPRLAVSFVGLDLATPEGVGLLEGRINRAIDVICPDADTRRNLKRATSVSRCRRDAVASVTPQVDDAVAAAEQRASGPDREWLSPPPQPPVTSAPRMPEYAYRRSAPPIRDAVPDGPAPRMPDFTDRPAAPMTRVAPPPPAPRYVPLDPAPQLRLVKRVVRKTVVTRTVTTTTVSRGYRRHYGPGTWLPPRAFAAIEHAAARAFATGRRVHWTYRDRAGYVTVGAKRWVAGQACRHITIVKTSGGRAVVVAAGMRCRDRHGRFTDRDC